MLSLAVVHRFAQSDECRTEESGPFAALAGGRPAVISVTDAR